MKSCAKITMDSLRTYSATVQQFVDYSSTATEAMADFDNLIDLIKVEIRNLEEKRYQLNEAGAVIENKIAECEAKIESTQSYIADLEEDLAAVQAEIEVTDDTMTIPDFDGNSHEIPNAYYISLTKKEAVLEGKLLSANKELVELEKQLSRCGSLKRELSTVLSEVEKQIETLSSNIRCVEKNKSEYSSTVANVKIHSTIASSKLSMIEQTLNNYIGIRLKVIPAFEAVKSEGSTRNLNDLAFLSSKFMNASSKSNKSTMRNIDDEGRVFRNSEGLVPNSTFKLNSYTFTTDSLGRPVSASGKLKLVKDKPRNWDATLNDMGQGDERDGDERGHMIGHRFDGPDSIINAIPQDSRINQGEYKDFEDTLATELNSGKEVFVSISPIYHSDSRRPTGVVISYTIDGVRDMRFFNNEIKEGE